MPELPSFVDPHLWIESALCDHRDFLVGNRHSAPGHMRAYCPHRDITYAITLNEITDSSPSSATWIQGFLAGNEPGPDDMFGPTVDGEHDDTRLERWQTAIEHFRLTGHWWPTRWFPLPDLSPIDVGAHQPYAIVGDECWVWVPGGWVLEEVLPDTSAVTVRGTPCDPPGQHRMTLVGDDRVICEVCGLVA